MVKLIKRCIECGKEFEIYPSSRNVNVYCSMNCRNKSKRWKERIRIANQREFKGTHSQIKTLTNKILGIEKGKKYPCSNCGKIIKNIHIHHLNSNRLDNKRENLSLLCNECHNILHYNQKDFSLCEICGRIKRKGKEHICPKEEEYRIIAIKNYQKRERCEICGKLLGKDKTKHSCEHPRGMKGHKHTEITKEKIGESVRKNRWKK